MDQDLVKEVRGLFGGMGNSSIRERCRGSDTAKIDFSYEILYRPPITQPLFQPSSTSPFLTKGLTGDARGETPSVSIYVPVSR